MWEYLNICFFYFAIMDYFYSCWGNGVEVFILASEHSYSTTFDFSLFTPYDYEAYKKSFVTKLLTKGTRRYPSEQKLENVLLALCDADCVVQPKQYYNIHGVSLCLDVLTDKRVVGRRRTLDKAVSLMYEMLNRPLMLHGLFDENNFDQTKQQIKLFLKQQKNDRQSVSFYNFLRLFYGDNPLTSPIFGTEEQVDALTNQDVANVYTRLVESSVKKIFVVSHLDPVKINELLRSYFKVLLDGEECFPRLLDLPKPTVVWQEELSDFNQTVVYVGFPLRAVQSFREHEALNILNSYFAEMRIFKQVREKSNLAYDAYSYLDYPRNIIYSTAGVAKENKKKAVDIMMREFDNLLAGKIFKKQLKQAKRNYLNKKRMVLHKKSRKLSFLVSAAVLRNFEFVENYENILSDISVDEIVQAATNIVDRPVVYCLVGK
jgi:predicted Zn-dependent peptidase